jgi:hypothetical protein
MIVEQPVTGHGRQLLSDGELAAGRQSIDENEPYKTSTSDFVVCCRYVNPVRLANHS